MKHRNKISKQEIEKIKDKIETFKYLRQQRVSYYQGIYIALLVGAVVLLVDLIAEADIFLKIMLIIILVFGSEIVYKKMLIQTQKSVLCLENAICTIENGPISVKGKDRKEYAVFQVSDFVHQNGKTKNKVQTD